MKIRLNAYVPEELLKRVRELADGEGRTLSAVVERALEAYIKENDDDGNTGRDPHDAG